MKMLMNDFSKVSRIAKHLTSDPELVRRMGGHETGAYMGHDMHEALLKCGQNTAVHADPMILLNLHIDRFTRSLPYCRRKTATQRSIRHVLGATDDRESIQTRAGAEGQYSSDLI